MLSYITSRYLKITLKLGRVKSLYFQSLSIDQELGMKIKMSHLLFIRAMRAKILPEHSESFPNK